MGNANDVFEKAIHLMDEQSEITGEVLTQDTQEYKFRTLSILNVLRNELWEISETREFGIPSPEIMDFTTPIFLDTYCVDTLMPYGLAAHLLIGENDAMASFFNQRYQELLYARRAKGICVWEDIPDPFG